MLNFPKWKIILILAVCFVATVIAFPNILPENAKNETEEKYGLKSVNLGLDLRGGSYLLLGVDVDKYFAEQYQFLLDDIRIRLREKKIGYVNLTVESNEINFAIRGDNGADVDDVFDGIRQNLDIKINEKLVRLSFSDNYKKSTMKDVVGQSIETVRRRVDETGTREPIIQRQGENRILLQVPGLNSPEHLKQLLGKTAKMTFHLMDDTDPFPSTQRVPPAGTMLLTGEKDEKQQYYLVKKKVELDGNSLVDAKISYDEYGSPAVSFRFNTAGGKKFSQITRENIGKPFAIVLDGKVITAPVIIGAITGGSGQITGSFSVQEAENLSLLLRSGALPAPLNILEERTVGPSLGKDSIEAGKKASLLGVFLVMLFMIIFYGLFGLFANIALVFNIIILFALLSIFQATLTLPGIAGIVLTIGMAVDANVIIFERIREEMALGRTPFAATDHGFRNAFSTILDSNLTTIFATLLLYIFGSGPVRGFAVTLTIGVLASMFTAILLTRMMIVIWLKKLKPRTIPL